jgi:selenocysteine lyase/cysteine desulfurase
VDGAHMPGQVPVNLREIGCDIFAASLHKWMLTPPGCGFLFVRQDFQKNLWPTVVVEGWEKNTDAVKYMLLGCNNIAEIQGAREALRFIQSIGRERIQKRIHELARYTWQQAAAIPYLRLLSAAGDSLYGGMVAFAAPGKDYAPMWAKLAENKVWTLRGEKIRVSCHIHTRKSDIDLLFKSLREVWG